MAYVPDWVDPILDKIRDDREPSLAPALAVVRRAANKHAAFVTSYDVDHDSASVHLRMTILTTFFTAEPIPDEESFFRVFEPAVEDPNGPEEPDFAQEALQVAFPSLLCYQSSWSDPEWAVTGGWGMEFVAPGTVAVCFSFC